MTEQQQPRDLNVDPEQFRQFQEFLRFQEAQRQQGGAPPEGTEAKHAPLWRRLLRNKWLRRLVLYPFMLLIAFGVYLLFFTGSSDERRGGERHKDGSPANPVLPQAPKDTVKALYGYVADGKPIEACVLFRQEAAAKFSRDHGAENGDCQQAVRQLASEVKDKKAYADPKIPEAAVTISGDTAEIQSCAMTVDGGRPLGLFILQRQENKGWIISDHKTEPADCRTG